MTVKAKLRFLRQTPRKVRVLAQMVRGMNVTQALHTLTYSQKRAGRPLIKLINSAISNAVNNFSLKQDNLFIKEIRIDGGPVLKRWRARAFGRAAMIKKRTSHIYLTLDEIRPTTPESVKSKASVNQDDVKVVSSLDEVNQESESKDRGHEEQKLKSKKDKGKQHIKDQTPKQETKRKIFSRKSG